MNWALSVYKKISDRILETPKIDERFTLKSLNQFCFITIGIAFVWIIAFAILQWYAALALTVYSAISFGTVLFLNYNKNYRLAKAVLVFATNSSVVGITFILGYSSGFYLYLFTAPLFIFWLFDIQKERKYIYASIASYFISYFITLFCKNDTIPITFYSTSQFSFTLYDLNIIASVLFLFVLCNNYVTYFSILRRELLQEKEYLREEVVLRKQDQLKLKKLYNELKTTNVNLEQFGFMVSHNIRAPFANIKGFLELYDPNSEDEKEKAEIVECIHKSVYNLDGVLNDLIFLLTLRKDLKEEKEVLIFSELIEGIKQSLSFDIIQKGIKITEKYPFDFKIKTVRTIIHSVLFNLIQNAIKYRDEKKETEIIIKSSEKDRNYTIEVSDNGVGIDLEKNQNKIFNLYNKFHSNKDGKGVGLYMVKTQVTLLGGSISVASMPNVGTTFTITFPK
jgi:signal transduction histidine kinase